MRISKDALKGYLLEEVLAYLIKGAGYRLLVDPSQDPRDLDRKQNGLVVKGRGSDHQVDVLGQLYWIPAFTFPIRLFVEAKCRKTKTGISAVRNAIGVLLDINQNNSPTRENNEFYQKYQYVYALFSTSGFSENATDMAIAHQISLVDLSGNEFDELKLKIDTVAGQISGSSIQTGGLNNIRDVLRSSLGTWPEGIDRRHSRHEDDFREKLVPVKEIAEEYGALFIAMANGPFALLLKAGNPGSFLRYAKSKPSHDVVISWNLDENGGKTWKISPSSNPSVYSLSFRLPSKLAEYVFGNVNGYRERALQVKNSFFSSLSIYHIDEKQDYIFKLRYNSEETKKYIDELRNNQNASRKDLL